MKSYIFGMIFEWPWQLISGWGRGLKHYLNILKIILKFEPLCTPPNTGLYVNFRLVLWLTFTTENTYTLERRNGKPKLPPPPPHPLFRVVGLKQAGKHKQCCFNNFSAYLLWGNKERKRKLPLHITDYVTFEVISKTEWNRVASPKFGHHAPSSEFYNSLKFFL